MQFIFVGPEKGTNATVTKLTNITDKIFKCRTNDKSLTERNCPDQNLFNVRGKTKPQWQIAWGRE